MKISNVRLVRKYLEPHIFEHKTFKKKVWDYILVKEYRLEKTRNSIYLYKENIKTLFWHSLFDLFTIEPNLSYELWDIRKYLFRFNWYLYNRRQDHLWLKQQRRLKAIIKKHSE